jgi:hypothetical protein
MLTVGRRPTTTQKIIRRGAVCRFSFWQSPYRLKRRLKRIDLPGWCPSSGSISTIRKSGLARLEPCAGNTGLIRQTERTSHGPQHRVGAGKFIRIMSGRSVLPSQDPLNVIRESIVTSTPQSLTHLNGYPPNLSQHSSNKTLVQSPTTRDTTLPNPRFAHPNPISPPAVP